MTTPENEKRRRGPERTIHFTPKLLSCESPVPMCQEKRNRALNHGVPGYAFGFDSCGACEPAFSAATARRLGRSSGNPRPALTAWPVVGSRCLGGQLGRAASPQAKTAAENAA